MRLNACGEKVWCKVIRYYDMNYGYRVKIRSDGNYALYTRYAAPQGYKADKLWVIDTAGNNLSSFHVVPPGTHPNIGDPLVEDFIITSDQGYLFSGSCYFPLDTLNPTIWRLQHMLVKVDSVGNIQWIRPQFIDSNHVGVLLSSAELNEVFYAVGYDYTAVKTNIDAGYISDPYNGKFNFAGNLLYEKVLHPDTMFNFLKYIQPMSNGTLIQTGVITHDSAGDPPYYMGVFKTDTMFNILNYLENDTGSVTNECITSSIDGKFLITGYCPPESSYTEVDGLAIKVNSDLQYDSLYSFPFVYDSLCPFPILTDTIDCDCDIITGYGKQAGTEEQYRLQVFPNPAAAKVQVRLKDVIGGNAIGGGKLILYDLFGRTILTRDFGKEAVVDVTALNAGIYLVMVKQKGTILARDKLVVLK
ncbi:MAG: T9SS type A sorting domain-containing protein [Bacteroidota bacterium]